VNEESVDGARRVMMEEVLDELLRRLDASLFRAAELLHRPAESRDGGLGIVGWLQLHVNLSRA
jgi:hypothetical protein